VNRRDAIAWVDVKEEPQPDGSLFKLFVSRMGAIW
jgi:hypothetical protein